MKKNIKYLFMSINLLVICGCSDYFDVRPKSQVLAEELFSSEQGFNDQLIGVYKRMSQNTLYGKELMFGLTEVLSQNYDLPAGSLYEKAAEYNYRDAAIRSSIDSIWLGMYSGIANLNILLEYVDKDLSIFSDNNYKLYKGEALGLRAFLHFDLLRLFAPAYSSNPSAKAIPYVTQYTTAVTPQGTVAEVVDNIITDLKEALVLLEVDPLYVTDSTNAYYYRDARSHRFNYYAAAATLARAYQWKGTDADLAQALIYARKVIDDKRFSWVHYSAMDASNKHERDLLFTNELVFQLNIVNMDKLIPPYFSYNRTSPEKMLLYSTNKRDEIFEITSKGYGAEYRCNNLWEYDGEATVPFLAKFWQYENGSHKDHMPLIRWSEMYYIAAEASVKSNPQQAVTYLNTVRDNRRILDALSETLTTDQIRNEIYKEYRKELLAEGQLFYYYKRLGYSKIPGSSTTANNAVYVLPMPENEIEFGNRN